ncbi:hypothetical protein FALBO_9464 [Fusarium albosuccineum]|uniref:Uncharacterized protein n=1 Tax=Fusarium albosuccineum TaxID=1237068 RepID=A0A8H4L9C5_9HYPO|nr:hypothetical protein FALBO_9464 [Fusarium albosuccineum]
MSDSGDISEYYHDVTHSSPFLDPNTKEECYDRVICYSPAPGAVEYALQRVVRGAQGETFEPPRALVPHATIPSNVFCPSRVLLPLMEPIQQLSACPRNQSGLQLRPGGRVTDQHLRQAWEGLDDALLTLRKHNVYTQHQIKVDLRNVQCTDDDALMNQYFDPVSTHDELWVSVDLMEHGMLQGSIGFWHNLRGEKPMICLYDCSSGPEDKPSRLHKAALKFYWQYIKGTEAASEDDEDRQPLLERVQKGPLLADSLQQGLGGAFLVKVACHRLLARRGRVAGEGVVVLKPGHPGVVNEPDLMKADPMFFNQRRDPAAFDRVFVGALADLLPNPGTPPSGPA